MKMRRSSPIVAALLLSAWGLPAWADPKPEAGEAAPAAPSRDLSTLTEDYEWPAGTIREQLDKDNTLVPFGKGAIFVPAMTNPLDEPPITIRSGGQKVAEATTGQRIVLSPGTYEVQLGSGAEQTRIAVQASVRERNTTVIPVSWSGLSIHVVDEQFGSLRGSYEIIRVEDREYIGLGFGTDEQAGEPVSTWIMRPGLYKLVRVGDNYRARRDFVTVRLRPGRHTHFLLVLDRDTGTFSGGGEVPKEDLFTAQEGFFYNLVLGGDASLNFSQNNPNVTDGLGFRFRAFVDGRMTIRIFDSPLVLQLQVEEGQSKQPNSPFQKTNDRIDLDALYIYKLTSFLGPYLRLSAETNMLPGPKFVDQIGGDVAASDITLYERDEAGEVPRDENGVPVALGDAQSLNLSRTSPPVGLTTMREGLGLNARLLKTLFAETTVRAGFGARHTLTRNFFSRAPSDEGFADNSFIRGRSINQIGVEATVLAIARLTRWVLITLELDTLLPFNNIKNFAERVVVEAETSVALKLTSYFAINYVARYRRDRFLFDKDIIQQDVLLRFSLEVF